MLIQYKYMMSRSLSAILINLLTWLLPKLSQKTRSMLANAASDPNNHLLKLVQEYATMEF